MRRPHFLAGFLLFAPVATVAQTAEGETRFTRELDAVHWRHESTLRTASPLFDLRFRNRVGSRFFLLNNQARNIQDERHHDLRLTAMLTTGIGLATDLRSFEFSSTRTRQDVAMAGVELQPATWVRTRAQVGVMSDQRNSDPDQGMVYGFDAWTPGFTLPGSEWRLDPSVRIEVADIRARRFLTSRYATDVGYRIGDMGLDVRLLHGLSRREGYSTSSILNTAESPYIESIRIDTTLVSLETRFPLSRRWNGTIRVDLLNQLRQVQNRNRPADIAFPLYNSRALRQALDTRVELQHRGRRLESAFGFAVGAAIRDSRLTDTDGLPPDQVRRRADILSNSNFSQNRLEVFTDHRWILSEGQFLSGSASTSILRYDTPDLNPDDRDELSLQLRLRHDIRFNPYFKVGWLAAGEAYHLVYLNAERSIENNWRRSVRLMPQLVWTPTSNMTWTNRYLIRANYTVEDFELEGRPKTDQSSRELVADSELDWRFLPGWAVNGRVSRGELRIGRLLWKEFREVPLDTLVTIDAQGGLRHDVGPGTLTVGLRVFHKTDFVLRAVNTISVEGQDFTRIGPGIQTTRQWGPTVSVSWPIADRHLILINGWMQWQQTWTRLYVTYPAQQAAAFRRAERNPDRRSYPNLDMTVRFRF